MVVNVQVKVKYQQFVHTKLNLLKDGSDCDPAASGTSRESELEPELKLETLSIITASSQI